jgi:hypothetical protein
MKSNAQLRRDDSDDEVPIILTVVMMRMMRLGLHPWQRMLEFSFVLLSFCCLRHLVYILQYFVKIMD